MFNRKEIDEIKRDIKRIHARIDILDNRIDALNKGEFDNGFRATPEGVKFYMVNVYTMREDLDKLMMELGYRVEDKPAKREIVQVNDKASEGE